MELVDKIGREYYLAEIIKVVENQYEYIVLDCPPSLGLITLNALCAARELLIPLQCEFFALEGIVKLLHTYELVKKRLNFSLALLGVVLTMYDMRNKLTRQVKNEVRKCFPDHLFETVIPRNVRLSEAPSHGKSIIHYDIKSKGAEAYLALAKEVILRKPRKDA
jgi:chromosome partitioning protein